MVEILFKSAKLSFAFLGLIMGCGLLVICNIYLSFYSQQLSNIIGIWFVVIFCLFGFICGHVIQTFYTMAHRDQLTDLWNRRYFYIKLGQAVNQFKRTKAPLCIALLDIDDFKTINDVYGHLVGDAVLKEVALVLKKSTRDIDVVVRFGGDEFAIILAETDLESAAAIAERVRETIQGSTNCCQTTISVGVLLIHPEIEIKVEKIIKLVDETLYKAKNTKNLVVSTLHY